MFNNFLGALAGINIYLYGLGVSLALLLVLFLFWRNIRKTSYSEEKLVDALFSAAVSGLLFGRFFQVILYPVAYEGGVLTWLNLVSYPGVFGFFFWLGFLGFWFVYGARRKYPFKSLLKLLLAPLVYGLLLLAVFSLLLRVNWAEILNLALYVVLIGLYFLITRVLKKTAYKERQGLSLAIYLTLPPFIVDFLKEGRVYFFEQKIISVEQLPYLVLLVVAIIISLLRLIKKKK